MKKKIFVLLPFLATILCSCGSGTHYPLSEYCLEMPYKENFSILQLSDIHLGNKDNQHKHLEFMNQIFEDSPKEIDLVVITGDLFTFADKNTAKRLFSWLDEKEIPWTVTFGNHDEQCYFSIEWLTSYLNDLNNSDESYCLFKDLQDDDIFGNANFAINLMDGQNIKEQVIILDSNRYYYGSYFGYDWIKEDQIEWYSNLVDYTKSLNGGTVVPSTAFFHIPFPEFGDAMEAVSSGGATLIYGDNREGVSCPEYNSGLFDKILEKGSTYGVFCGHDHVNSSVVLYKNVYLGYCLTSTDRIYADSDRMGGTLITLNGDRKLSFELIEATYGG